ncbi:MAG TPA: DUF418 domain-containing protein [Prolixibacteraceae bacterium]|nr:DUF418 domain-containing protein [Prolixibacteraceae bacterium]
MSSVYQPLKDRERLEILDFLRGFALLGILMVNLPLMNAPFTCEMKNFMIWTDPINKAFAFVIKFFFTGKFYPLFSMLFGIGFYFFLKKFDEVRKPILPTYRFRLMWLLLFGILHVVLLWYGDILIVYALMGFVMVWFRKKSNKTLITWAVCLITLPVVLVGLLVGLFQLAMNYPEVAGQINQSLETAMAQLTAFTQKALETYPSGTFSEIVSIRLEEYQSMMGSLIIFFPNVLAFFLVGIVLGKKRVFTDLLARRSFFVKLLLWSLPVALAGNLLLAITASDVNYSMLTPGMLYNLAASSIGGPALTLVYISSLVLIYQNGFFGKLAGAIGKTGRMALTNYLMQSVICTTLFFSYGLGLYGKVNLWQGMLLVLAVYLVEVIWSHFWLSHFRFGPMEWLWRTLTYRKAQSMKKIAE